MAKITHLENQVNADFTAGEKVAIYVNGTLYKEYTVATGNTAKATFMYQESANP